MGEGWRQFRLLLWKDYLTRKRKSVALLGVFWATVVILSLYIVRSNIDNVDFSTCQFAARALPSAGMLTFLQSFICSVNNECSALDKYQDIPTYENSKLTQLQRKFSPLLYNETVLDTAATMPDALKLLNKLAEVVDEPTFLEISKNGLTLSDLFHNPNRVQRYISNVLKLDEDVMLSIMMAELDFQGIFKGMGRCNSDSIKAIVKGIDTKSLDEFAKALCSLSNKETQSLMMNLLVEIDFNKFIRMLGNMYSKLNGDTRLTELADTMRAILRMTRLESFLPKELAPIFNVDVDFTYIDLGMISQFLDLFKPTFSDSESFKTTNELVDSAIVAVKYLSKVFSKQNNDTVGNSVAYVGQDADNHGMNGATNLLNNAVAVLKESTSNGSSVDVINILSKLTNFIFKWLPDRTKHDVLLYSTLLAKLMEGANKVVNINMKLEELTYSVTLRHPDAMKVLVSLPPTMISKGFDALSDADRTLIATAKINNPGQMFCNDKKLQNFFRVSKDEATSLKKQLCNDSWTNFINDLVDLFGVYEVRDNINTMASIFIQETLGKDVSSQLYTLDHVFKVLSNFTSSLRNIQPVENIKRNWTELFHVSEDSEFMKVVKKKSHLGNQILITVHGCLAKEVVKQNPILSFKLSPYLVDMTTIVVAINKQLQTTNNDNVEKMKALYPAVVETILITALDEDKASKSLSSHFEDILCNGVETASSYLELPDKIDRELLLTTLCEVSRDINTGLAKDSEFGKAIATVMKANHDAFTEVDWMTLITGVKNMYVKLNQDYPYLFQYGEYGMDNNTKLQLENMLDKAKDYWFGQEVSTSVYLCVKLTFRLLDLMDYDIFNVTNQYWVKAKYSAHSISGPVFIFHDVVKAVTGLLQNDTAASGLPPITVSALEQIVPNIPQFLIDGVDLLVRDDADEEEIITFLNTEPYWPCSNTSISDLLNMSSTAQIAINGFETLLCNDRALQEEWMMYLEEKKVGSLDLKKLNSTEISPHVFLRLSSALDALLEDGKTFVAVIHHFEDDENSSPWKEATDYAHEVFSGSERDDILRKAFMKFDEILNSVKTSVSEDSTLNKLWGDYAQCSRDGYISDECKIISRASWKSSMQYLSVVLDNAADDLLIYFKEVKEPYANPLQILGFTKNTPLYALYRQLPEYIVVLVNSYFDYGFMSQIRKAALTEFWDCEAVVLAMVPPVDSPIDADAIARIQPYICPSLLYWVSLPKGDNSLLNLVAKPNYFLYTADIDSLTSSYLGTYNKMMELANLINTVTESNTTSLAEYDIKLDALDYKLTHVVDKSLNYTVKDADVSYRLFNQVNEKQIISTAYLTKIVVIVNKIMAKLESLKVSDVTDSTDKEDVKKIMTDLIDIDNIFKRKPHEAVALHFDVITNLMWKVNDYYVLNDAFDVMCEDFKNNDTNKDILVDNQRTKAIFCSKDYKAMYNDIENDIEDDLNNAKKSLVRLVSILQNDDNLDKITDINEFFNQRELVTKNLKKSVRYAYDLGIPIYLQYLQSNLEHYDIILAFLSGEDWWTQLRELYKGPYATKFLDAAENSFEIAQDVLGGLDRIHFVRLIHDLKTNGSDVFCDDSIVLSEYIPDSSGILSELKKQMCLEDKTEMYAELPPLVFAAQGYESKLKLSNEVNYTAIDLDITETESRLNLIRNGPMPPKRPFWITDEKIAHLRKAALNILTKETLTTVVFGLLSNIVDAGTLFLNNSYCEVCSQFTSWFKQVNLQVFKKQEYDALYCRLQDMTLDEVYLTLKNDFHWDMAIQELVSIRNYTKYELNKSMNHFLELVKVHLLEDLTMNKLSECLVRNVTRNQFGNATFFFSVLSNTARLLRSVTPHLHEIRGFTDSPYLKKIHAEVAHNLPVMGPLRKYLKNGYPKELKELVKDDVLEDILNGDLDLRLVRDESLASLQLDHKNWYEICEDHNCSMIMDVIYNNVDRTLVEKELPKLQSEEFWKLNFVSNILKHLENLLQHIGRIAGVGSKVDVEGVMEGKLVSMVDFAIQVLVDDSANAVLYSLQGLVEELHPLLQTAPLEADLRALAKGVAILYQFKNYLLDNEELRLEISTLFRNPDRVETGLSRLGINNTNFWSIAAPRVHAGYIDLRPIFASKQDSHISSYVCQMDAMSHVIQPGDLDVVTADDVYAAIVDQFCGLDDTRTKDMMAVVLAGVDFGAVMEKVKNILLPQLYTSANLTVAEGDLVLKRFPEMAALLPVIQDNVGDLTETIANEPLVKDLGKSSSVGGLLGSPSFLKNAGNMMCGAPFETNQNRFYKAIAQSQDFTSQPDQAQLDVLPTDFCRDMYRDVLKMEGGKIVWSFVKPLIMGKILYTPDNTVTRRIMAEANSSFAHMIRLTSLIHSFADSFTSLEGISQHRAGVSALRHLMTSPDIRRMLIGEGEVPDVDVDSLFGDIGDMQGTGRLLKRGSSLLRCINLNRFEAVPDEDHLTHLAVKLSRVNEFSAGIVFLNTEQTSETPSKVEYKIRMDIENSPTTSRTRNFLWVPGPESSFIEDMRYFRGFIQIQDMVDNAIIQLSRSNTRQKREMKDEPKFAVYTQQEPYPCYRKDYFQTSLYESQAMIVTFFFALMFTVASAVRFIVTDKESGNTMLMSVMGVNLRWHTISWSVSTLCELAVTCACVCLVLRAGAVLPATAVSLLTSLLMLYALSLLAFCYMISKMFVTASTATVCASIVYLTSYMPFVLILSLEAVISAAAKVTVCLSMSTAFSFCLLHISRLEATGEGANWTNMWNGGVDSIAVGAAMMLVDAVLYLVIGMVVDKYFGPKTLSSNITQISTSDEKAGVSVVNVSKTYGEGRRSKLALDNVSIELHKGQITTLLGHNGAGKTTLLNILTGMLRPSKGHVVIRSEHSGGTTLGVCPQKDVLFDFMTPSEHVALYAQLKSGKLLSEVQDEVDSILQVLSLGPVSGQQACRLSGGTRRRLCVALAFVAQPHLVSLDEPTAGVDPAARRDIWSMIVKLRENRTILLTTHHLDEAELLSDQIVIMHKGQVHTTGSPIEIKRSLGNGYKLTVMYPDKSNCEPWEDDNEVSIEERSKQLMSVVRGEIKNAGLVDVTGLEVEVTLPFFDANGVNNNYLQLCTALESRQQSLGFKDYSLDCSSLEQVFFGICQKADAPNGIEYVPEPDMPSKSASTSSVKSDGSPLVPAEGPLKGSAWSQFTALLYARYLHYIRNRGLLFLLLVLPSLFVTTAMAFSLIRPPADNELALRLVPDIYEGTSYLVPEPSIHSKSMDPTFAETVMNHLRIAGARNWTEKDTPQCQCTATRQECNLSTQDSENLPQMMITPDMETLNQWIVTSHDVYIEKRYGGYSSTLKNNLTHLVAWYNNKGHHAMPAFLNSLNNAVLRTVSGNMAANITVYSHPLKISKEQISKDTVYQHVADAGISVLVLLSYCVVCACGAASLVRARAQQHKRLQLLTGVQPAVYWAATMAGDMAVILINLMITVIVFEAFGFPVFVARNNLPAICLLIILFGFACNSFVHVFEKLFREPSLANMILLSGNAFIGCVGIALLLILDIISTSEATDNARWVLHKVFMVFPQFVLGDGLLEIAKNTVQAQVLERFGMDTYKDPFSTDLVAFHYAALAIVGTFLTILNLAIEYDCFQMLVLRLSPAAAPPSGELEALEVGAERARVLRAAARAHHTLRLPTIGNINAGFIDTEVKNNSIKRVVSPARDAAMAVELTKVYAGKVAVNRLTLGIPAGQCTALLGENGAGKSTTFSMLTGETRPAAGHVYLNDRRCDAQALCGGLISYCPQSDALDPLLTVTETLEFYCRLRGITEADEVVKRTLSMFDLRKYRLVRCGLLSGGNKRKLCTAVAFMGRTTLVLLDEPTSGMDPVSRLCVAAGVRCARVCGRGVLVSTHALRDARTLAARVALLRRGTLAALDTLQDCLRRFGGGWVVSVRTWCPRAAWPRVRALAPHARLRAIHHAILHLHVPTLATVNGKEVTTNLSDIFRLMSELQATCDIEDYTVNQSSLDQMFLSFSDKSEELDSVSVEPLPSPEALRKISEDNEISNSTSL